MQFHDPAGNRQTEPESAILFVAIALGRLFKGLKDPLERFRSETNAGIADPHGNATGSRFEGFDIDAAILWGEFPRVAQDIPEHLEEAVAIALNPGLRRMEPHRGSGNLIASLGVQQVRTASSSRR